MFEQRNSHIVIKRKWLHQNLSDEERAILSILLTKAVKNKPEHEYYVVNLDEPYADKVKNIIYEGEKEKSNVQSE